MPVRKLLFVKSLYASLLGICCQQMVLAAETTVVLEDLAVHLPNVQRQGLPLAGMSLGSERVIGGGQLRQRGANLGDALAGEPGIHASAFGAGASAPVIRGQQGKRVKILSGGNETLDMSAMSPDHAITVDSVLAQRVELLRGASTLLHASGNSSGVVNVVDKKIPESLPEHSRTELGLRMGSVDNERLLHGVFDSKLGDQVAVHAEGLYKSNDDYRTPPYQYEGKTLNKLANSFAVSKSASLGLSWVGDEGYIGLAHSRRFDRYGLPAHSHLYDGYYMHILRNEATWPDAYPYLQHFPFLMEETDIDYNNPGLDCVKKGYHTHTHLCGEHDHSHGGGNTTTQNHATTHHHPDPHIDLVSKRWDVRALWRSPWRKLSALRLNATRVDYHHDEKSGAVTDNAFKNGGYALRLEAVHQLSDDISGVLGASYSSQSSHALDNHTQSYRRQNLLHDHSVSTGSVFALERLARDHWQVDLAGRIEHQKIAMDYRTTDPKTILPPEELQRPHESTAYSYALSGIWQVNPKHKLSAVLSHQERLPNAQELYAHGKHLATNAFEAGNKNLNKERSNNIELGWTYTGDQWDATLNGYYNHFANYVYAAILNNTRCPHNPDGRCKRALSDKFPLRLYRYNQAAARIYGLEAEIGYQWTPNHRVALFGDYVNATLKDLPDLPIGYKYATGKDKPELLGVIRQPDGYAPRTPPLRLGLKWDGNFGDHINSQVQLYRIFAQNNVALLEQPTPGHLMLNAAINYRHNWHGYNYKAFVRGNNLLNSIAYNHASFLPYIPQSGRGIQAGVNMVF